jgi:hypothetical protein
MIKIAGTLPVKSRLPLGAWLLAALVTVFSFASSLTNAGTKPNQDSPIAFQENQPTQEAHANVLAALAQIAEVLTPPG